MTLPPDPPSDPAADPGEVTRLLHLARDGDREALDRLVPLVYEDLRRMAHRQLDREGGGHTLQTTGLLHEAYLKLAGSGAANAANRAHFLAIAALEVAIAIGDSGKLTPLISHRVTAAGVEPLAAG